MATQITALPIPPSRQDPANFSARADAFLGALPTFQTEANLLATEAEQDALTASTAATNAANSAASALASKNAAEAALDSFDDRYLGAKNANPTLDNDGQALLTGALYYNTVVPELRVYNGTAWVTASTVGGTVTNLTVLNNFTPPDNSIALGAKTTGNYAASVAVSGSGLSVTGAAGEGTNFVINSNATSSNTGNTLVFRDGSGNFSAGEISLTQATSNLKNNQQSFANQHQTAAPYYNVFSQNGSEYQAVIKGVCIGSSFTQHFSFGNLHFIGGSQQFGFHTINGDGSGSKFYGFPGDAGTIITSGNIGQQTVNRANSAAAVDNGVYNNGGTYSINITGNSASSNISSNSNLLQGFGSDVNGSGNSIVRRDGSGYIYTPYFNQTSGNNENPGISQIMVTNGGDNFLRKASIGHLTSSLTGLAPINITGSASQLTFGGANGYNSNLLNNGRISGVNYTNTTGRVLFVYLAGTNSPGNGAVLFFVNDARVGTFNGFGTEWGATVLIPVGVTYRFQNSNSTIQYWFEF